MKRLILKSAFLFFLSFVVCFGEASASTSNFEIPDGLVWLNSNRPVKVNDLKGKFVLVYFWNYGGVNVQSMVDQTRELQEKFPHELVVISVHTGKALNDDELNRYVVDAMGTYRITYPLAIDNQLVTLKAFHLDRWPAAVLFAPDGSLLFRKTGERDFYYFYSKIIAKNIPRFLASLDKKIIVFQSLENNTTVSSSGNADAATADLPEKVLSPTLMGNVILDHPAQVMTNETVVINAQAIPLNEAVEKKTGEDVPAPQNAFTFDAKNFVGEKIALDREYSQKIGTVDLKFRLPENAKLLGSAKSYVKIFTNDQKLLAQGVMKEPEAHILLNQEIPGDKLNIEATLYYCTESNHSICRIKSILFTVPLAAHQNQENISIEHELAGE